MGGLFWKKKRINLKHKNKNILIEVKLVPFWYEGFGLMFKRKKKANALLFSYGFPTTMTIFSLFIPFNFLAVWLDKKNNIIEKRVVKPGDEGVRPYSKFYKLIEIPITNKYKEIIKLLDGD